MGAHNIRRVNLHHNRRPYAGLFRADYRIQIAQNHIATMDGYHWISPRARRFS